MHCSVQCTHSLNSVHIQFIRDLVLLSGSVCHHVEETVCDQDLTGIPHGRVRCNVLYTHTTQTSHIPRLELINITDGLGTRLYTNIQTQLFHMYKYAPPPYKHMHTHTDKQTHTHTHTHTHCSKLLEGKPPVGSILRAGNSSLQYIQTNRSGIQAHTHTTPCSSGTYSSGVVHGST